MRRRICSFCLESLQCEGQSATRCIFKAKVCILNGFASKVGDLSLNFAFSLTRYAKSKRFEGKCFPSRSGKPLLLVEGQLFWAWGDHNEAHTVIVINPRMTASDITGPTSIQRAASILTAAKVSTAERP